MQDIHAIAATGRLFTAEPGGADRRLRPHHHGDNINNQNHHPQALKCPRCDSLNTKFCYYNNYNLSQPRHFCKNCRRYWTKGGVLRNVPVGGGCRKTKRSSSKPKANNNSAPERSEKAKGSSNSHSSSESSSTLTAAATTTATVDGGRIETVLDKNNNNNNNNENFELSVNDNSNNGGACFEQPPLMDSGNGDCGAIFSEMGSFTSLINSSSNETMSFGFSNILGGGDGHERWPRQHHQQQQQQKMVNGGDDEDFKGLLLDQTVQNEFSALQNNRSTVNNGGGFGALDWQGNESGGHQSVFDLTNTVDQAYWTQTQWTTADQDHSTLYLP